MWNMPPQGVQAGPWEGKSKPSKSYYTATHNVSFLLYLQEPTAERIFKLTAADDQHDHQEELPPHPYARYFIVHVS